MPTSLGLSYSTNSFPRMAWTTGAASASAIATTSSWAPSQPAPARIVTRPAAFSSSAARVKRLLPGVIVGTRLPDRRRPHVSRGVVEEDLARDDDDGDAASLDRVADRDLEHARQLLRDADELRVDAALAEQLLRMGLLEVRPPISSRGMCAAIASTGTRLLFASNSPLTRWRLPGPQLAAHTANSPVTVPRRLRRTPRPPRAGRAASRFLRRGAARRSDR